MILYNQGTYVQKTCTDIKVCLIVAVPGTVGIQHALLEVHDSKVNMIWAASIM